MSGEQDTTRPWDGSEPIPAGTEQLDRRLEADGATWAERVPDAHHLDALAGTLARTLDATRATATELVPAGGETSRGDRRVLPHDGMRTPAPLAFFRARSRGQNLLSVVAMVVVVGLMGALLLSLTHRGAPATAPRSGTPVASASVDTSLLATATPSVRTPTPARGTGPQGTLLWSFRTGNILESSVAVANGMVYIGGADANLYAVSSASGNRLWAVSVGATVQGPLTVANGLVYMTGVDGGVYAFSTKDGRQAWRMQPTGASFGAVSVVNGVVYVGSANNDASPSSLYALNAQTGATLWTAQVGGSIYTAPTVLDDVIFAIVQDRRGMGSFAAYAISLTSHTVLWQTPVRGWGLTASNGAVYVGGGSPDLLALDATTGKQLWDVTLDQHTETAVAMPTVADGVVYVGTGSGVLYALDASSGKQLWSYLTSGEILAIPAVVNGTVYVGSVDDSVYALTSPGKVVWRYETGGQVQTPAVVVDGVVYIGSFDHNVYALKA